MPTSDEQGDWEKKIIWSPLAIDTTNEVVNHSFLCDKIYYNQL
jgi:hypothetical protein